MDLGPELVGIRDGRRALIGPEHVVIDLTNTCNANCIACWTYSPLLRDKAAPVEWKRTELPAPVARALIDDLSLMATQRVRFTGGGEPFLHSEADALARRVRDRGMRCAFTTNLIGIDADRVLDTGCDELTVSLWAASASTYSRTHPNQSDRTFQRITGQLDRLSASPQGPEVTLANVISRINFHELSDMFDYAVDHGCRAVYYTLVDPVAERTDGLLLTDPERAQTLEVALQLKARAEAMGESAPYLDNFEGFLDRLRGSHATSGLYDSETVAEIPCYVGWLFCRILASGEVVPCCRGVEHPLGNLNEKRFPSIWFGPDYDDFRHKALSLPKSDAFFDSFQCYTTCDNLMHNRDAHRRLQALGPAGLEALARRLAPLVVT